MNGPIHHLAESDRWRGSTHTYRATSLDDEGFIHCSTAQQLDKVAFERFRGRNDLILLTLDPARLGSALVYEDLYGSGEQFPHVYGPIPLDAVQSAVPFLKHLEEDMWRPDTRFDRVWMDRVLHPDFEELGASGRRHSRMDTIEVSPTPFRASLPLLQYRLDLLADDVALVRYVSRITYQAVEERANRSSVWVETGDGWRLRFHQGTPVQGPAQV